MTIKQIAVVVAEVHAAAETITEHPAVAARPAARPLPIAERLETILPHVPEFILVNIPLVEIGPDRSDRHPGSTLVELVAHLRFVPPEKPLAGIAYVDASLLPRTSNKLQQLTELRIGQSQ